MEKFAMATPEEQKRFKDELFSPDAMIDPDNVSEDVIEEEMAMFRQLKRETGPGGEL